MKASRALALVAASAGALAVAGSASAADYLYFAFADVANGNTAPGGIGRIDTTSNAAETIVTLTGSGTKGVGIAATESALYFGVDNGTTVTSIDRTDLTGSGRTTVVPAAPGGQAPCLTVSGGSYNRTNASGTLTTDGTYLYYVCTDGSFNQYLARVKLDGTGLDETYLALGSGGYSYAAVSGGYAYLAASSQVSRVALTSGAQVQTGFATTGGLRGIAASGSYVYFGTTSPNAVGRAPIDLSSSNESFIPINSGAPAYGMVATGTSIFWSQTSGNSVSKAATSGPPAQQIATVGTRKIGSFAVPVAASGSTQPASPTTTPSGTAVAATTTPPAADLVRPATTTNTRQASRIGAVQVTVPLLLRQTGRYTFIFEGPSTQKSVMSVEMQNGKRVVQQKGSRLGKRKLTKPYTAPAVTMGTENARLVVSALIKKAQAKNLRLRVIHKATNGSLSEQVFNA